MNSDGPVTAQLFELAARGDRDSEEALMRRLGGELHALAEQHLGVKRDQATLQPTALVHEAWIRVSSREGLEFANRHAFLGFASRVMRNLLIDEARARKSAKRGGEARRVSLRDTLAVDRETEVELLDVEEALARLEASDAETARVVELRFYGGLSHPEIAKLLGWSLRSVERRWQFARAWLRSELVGDA